MHTQLVIKKTITKIKGSYYKIIIMVMSKGKGGGYALKGTHGQHGQASRLPSVFYFLICALVTSAFSYKFFSTCYILR